MLIEVQWLCKFILLTLCLVSGRASGCDAEKAKALLEEAGHADGLEFDLFTAEGVPGMVQMVQRFAQMISDIGVSVNVIETLRPTASGTTGG